MGTRARIAIAVLGAVVVGVVLARGSEGQSLPAASACPIFPSDSHWNQPVDRLPAHPRSDAIVAAVGRSENAHADFGSGHWDGGPIGIPYVVVGRGQRGVPVRFEHADESDRGAYPIPRDAPVEGGRGADGDRHVIVVDRHRCVLHELYAAHPVDGGRRWRAGSGARWDLRSNRLRPRGWTSADAAGLPILPGLVRWDEVRRGRIDHALRITVPRTRRAFVYPARHHASHLTGRDLPAMGQRVRLRRGFDVSSYPPQARVVLTALKRYGALVADNGSAWYVSGAPSPRWDNDDLHSLQRVRGADFEVVDTSRLPRPRR